MQVRFIVATRHDEAAFFKSSPLIESLGYVPEGLPVLVEPTFRSAGGLAPIYNAAIDSAQAGDLLVFAHDDVYADDWFLPLRVREGLATFDVIGVAGSRSSAVGSASWWNTKDDRTGDLVPSLRSGAVKHGWAGRRERIARFIDVKLNPLLPWTDLWQRVADGRYARIWSKRPNGTNRSVRHAGSYGAQLEMYGTAPAAVKLLDGLFMAARADRLKPSPVRFDPRFKYHLYDIDFCRQCERAGLTIGTWPIAVTHASPGRFDDRWRAASKVYLEKWGD